jgi:hypothetical protein
VQVWEVVHKGAGYAAVILAVAAFFTGFSALADDGAHVAVARGLFAAWVACGGLLFVGLAVRHVCTAADDEDTDPPAKSQPVTPRKTMHPDIDRDAALGVDSEAVGETARVSDAGDVGSSGRKRRHRDPADAVAPVEPNSLIALNAPGAVAVRVDQHLQPQPPQQQKQPRNHRDHDGHRDDHRDRDGGGGADHGDRHGQQRHRGKSSRSRERQPQAHSGRSSGKHRDHSPRS